MTVHYYDPGDDTWKSIQNPTPGDIAEILIASARNQPCPSCDASVEYVWHGCDGPPHITIVHEDGCAA